MLHRLQQVLQQGQGLERVLLRGLPYPQRVLQSDQAVPEQDVVEDRVVSGNPVVVVLWDHEAALLAESGLEKCLPGGGGAFIGVPGDPEEVAGEDEGEDEQPRQR